MRRLAVVLLTLGACTSSGTSTGATGKRIGVTLLTTEHEFYRQLEAGLRDAAQKHGYTLLITSGDFDLAKQQAEIDNFIVQRVDAIIACPVDSRGIGPAIARAQAAGIPVFTSDIRALGAHVVSHVASNSYEGGRLAAEFMAKTLHDTGTVAVIGQPEVQSGADRALGFSETLAKSHPHVQLVSVLNGGGVRDRALKAADDLLQAHPSLDGIFAINDESALGALSSATSHGKTGVNFTIVGYDATSEAVRAIKGHTPLKADVAQQPKLIGSETIDAIAAYFAKQPYDSVIAVPMTVVDSTTP
jgi:ribose transport system substrate-binding protein